MTTIAYRKPFLAADMRSSGWVKLHKIFPLGNDGYVAGAGYYDQVVEVATWLSSGSDPEKRPSIPDSDDSSNILIVDGGGVCYWLTVPYLRPIKIEEPFIAIGSGAEFAMGAMAAGASATRAVEIAAMYDPSTGDGVQTVRCGPRPKRKKGEKKADD
jgi:hypothetical protein